jgi:hypothetical protein
MAIDTAKRNTPGARRAELDNGTDLRLVARLVDGVRRSDKMFCDRQLTH